MAAVWPGDEDLVPGIRRGPAAGLLPRGEQGARDVVVFLEVRPGRGDAGVVGGAQHGQEAPGMPRHEARSDRSVPLRVEEGDKRAGGQGKQPARALVLVPQCREVTRSGLAGVRAGFRHVVHHPPG